ncbi:MAG: porin family protein [Chitinophagaceae bacterium]
MKKVFMASLACIAITTAFAQVRLGVEAGLNLANQHIQADVLGYSVGRTGNSIGSFHLGAVAEIEVAKNFYVRPKLLLSGKGACFKGDNDLGFGSDKVTLRPYYLELPVNAVYKYTLKNKMKLFAGFGPSFAYGLFGNIKSGNQKDDVFQDDGFKRFDFGLNYLAGVEFAKGLVASIYYTQGLSNAYNGNTDENLKWKNRVFSISIGYMLDK